MKHSMLAAVALVLSPSLAFAAQQVDAPPAQQDPAASAVAARVNGFAITEQAVDDEMLDIQRTQGRGVSPELRPKVLESLIDQRLLDEEVERQAVTATPEDLRAAMTRNFEGYVLSTQMPRAFVAEQIQQAEGLTIEQFIEERAADEGFRRFVLHKRLVCKLHPVETKVAAEEVEAQYALKTASDFTIPTVVRASHILIGTQDLDAAGKEAALQKARALRAQVLEPGADFAGLALEHSICPSKAQGGDLGYFPHEGMVKPFSDAAFALSVGSVSDVVESQFGLHIIRVTDRSEGHTVPLAEAQDAIHDKLEFEKVQKVRTALLAKLRETAKIEYGPGHG